MMGGIFRFVRRNWKFVWGFFGSSLEEGPSRRVVRRSRKDFTTEAGTIYWFFPLFAFTLQSTNHTHNISIKPGGSRLWALGTPNH